MSIVPKPRRLVLTATCPSVICSQIQHYFTKCFLLNSRNQTMILNIHLFLLDLWIFDSFSALIPPTQKKSSQQETVISTKILSAENICVGETIPCTYIFLVLCCHSTILGKFVFILSVTSSYYIFQAGLPSSENLNEEDFFREKNSKSTSGLLKQWRKKKKLTSESKMLFYVVLILIQNENVLHFKRIWQVDDVRGQGYVPPTPTFKTARLLRRFWNQ